MSYEHEFKKIKENKIVLNALIMYLRLIVMSREKYYHLKNKNIEVEFS